MHPSLITSVAAKARLQDAGYDESIVDVYIQALDAVDHDDDNDMLPAFQHLDKEGQDVLSIPVLREYASLCRSDTLEDATLEAGLSEADLDETGVRLAEFASFTRALVDEAAWYLSWPFMQYLLLSLPLP